MWAAPIAPGLERTLGHEAGEARLERGLVLVLLQQLLLEPLWRRGSVREMARLLQQPCVVGPASD